MKKFYSLIVLIVFAISGCHFSPNEERIANIYSFHPDKALHQEPKKSFIELVDKNDSLLIDNIKTISGVYWYEANWLGMHVGDMFLQISPADKKQEKCIALVAMKARGIAWVVSKYESQSKTIFDCNNTNSIRPSNFSSQFQLRDNKRKINIAYDKQGNVIGEKNTPPENRAKRPAVSAKRKKEVFDPISGGIAAWMHIKNLLKEGGNDKFEIPIYDGRRRGDIKFSLIGRTKEKKLIHIKLKEDPIAGYTDSELESKKEWKAEVHLYLSPKKNFLPIKGYGKSSALKVSLNLAKKCESLQECQKAAE